MKRIEKELGRFVAKETQEYIRELEDQIREYKYTKYSYESDMGSHGQVEGAC